MRKRSTQQGRSSCDTRYLRCDLNKSLRPTKKWEHGLRLIRSRDEALLQSAATAMERGDMAAKSVTQCGGHDSKVKMRSREGIGGVPEVGSAHIVGAGHACRRHWRP
ncbi:hypothetical protein MRX96_014267 [Rhipicephalus microplus]